ncbi:hypothetical protein TWF481_003534 [Arthrobotrys musiformis]|uniref:Chromo shadow domain-containing protein n=1 Tax=Arthrobotrys musiformis TaxID=47236 RepID=A0AAV9VQJ6_9PEZI
MTELDLKYCKNVTSPDTYKRETFIDCSRTRSPTVEACQQVKCLDTALDSQRKELAAQVSNSSTGSETDIDLTTHSQRVAQADLCPNEDTAHQDIDTIVSHSVVNGEIYYEVRWKTTIVEETTMSKYKENVHYSNAHPLRRKNEVVYQVEWKNGRLLHEKLATDHPNLVKRYTQRCIESVELLRKHKAKRSTLKKTRARKRQGSETAGLSEELRRFLRSATDCRSSAG